MGPDKEKLPWCYRNVTPHGKRADVPFRIAATALTGTRLGSGLVRGPDGGTVVTPLPRLRKLGLIGTTLIVLGGLLVGVPPLRDPVLQASVFKELRAFTTPAVLCVFLGVSMLMLSWWRLGRL